MKRNKRYSRIKIKFAVAIGLIFAVSMIFFSVLVSAKSNEPKKPAYKYYTSVQINKGDTLWDIAKEYCDDASQMKEYVKELKSINHLSNDEIHAGNYLTIVYYSDIYK